jgi:hypothetical protein
LGGNTVFKKVDVRTVEERIPYITVKTGNVSLLAMERNPNQHDSQQQYAGGKGAETGGRMSSSAGSV